MSICLYKFFFFLLAISPILQDLHQYYLPPRNIIAHRDLIPPFNSKNN